MDSLEVDFVDLEPRLKDSRRQDTTPQDVLFSGRVIRLFHDVYPIEETVKKKRKY